MLKVAHYKMMIKIIIKLHLSVKPCSLGDTHTNKGTHTNTKYKTKKTKTYTIQNAV